MLPRGGRCRKPLDVMEVAPWEVLEVRLLSPLLVLCWQGSEDSWEAASAASSSSLV